MRFRVLGAVEMLLDGRPVDVGHARQQCVLAALLLDANRPVSAASLVDRVWAERPPQRARETLSGYLSRLRRILAGSDDARIIRRSGGYVLTVDPMSVDVHRFRRLAGQARSADDPGAADALYRQALRLWHGEAFATLDTPWLAAARESLDGERRAVEIEHYELVLGRGGHREILTELAASAAASPLDERLAGALMLALYRSGRQAEALRQYAELRHRLADELGADPSPPLRELHRGILAADAPAAPAPATPPTAGGTVPRQLPTPPRWFAGRAVELAELDAILAKAATESVATVIATVVGAAGIGKTSLALRWAHTVTEHFPDGQLYVDLRGFDPGGITGTAAEAVRGFLDAMGVPAARIPASAEAQSGLFRSLVAGRRMLFLLDNVRDAAHVRPLLPAAPGCLVLVTSRNQLAGLVAGEGAVPVRLDRLPAGDARDLLAGHLGARRVAAETEAVDEIVARCAGLPLALAVVAARAATNPAFALAELARELGAAGSGLDPLTAGDTHTDVRAVLSWSYGRLDPGGARLFRLLSVHPGPEIAVPAAASLAGWPAPATGARLAELAEVNLLDEPAPTRYALHDLLRVYTGELADRHDRPADLRVARGRLIAHYLHSAHAAALRLDPHRDPIPLGVPAAGVLATRFADLPEAWAWITAEYPVLYGLIEQTAQAGPPAQAWRLAWTLTDFLNRTGRWSDQVRVFSTAAAAARQAGDRPDEAYAERILARALARLGRHAEAHERLRTALALFRDAGDQAGLAHTHLGVAWVHEQQGDQHNALRHDRLALDGFRAAGHRIGQARALNNIGWRLGEAGDHGQALSYARDALALCRATGARYDEANTLDSVGHAHFRLGEHRQAVDYYRQALEIFREVGHRDGEAATLTNLGDAQQAAGDARAARAAWRAALAILRVLEHPKADAVRRRLAT